MIRVPRIRSRRALVLAGLVAGLSFGVVTPSGPASATGFTPGTTLTGGEIFLQGQYAEVGAKANGSFGTTAAAPAGFHPRSAQATAVLGFVVDRDKDGWGTGTDDGDFFTPGSPYEAWALQVGGSTATNSNAATGITGSFGSLVTGSGTERATWTADADYNGIQVSQVYSVPVNGQALHTDITLTNTTGSPIADVAFARFVDPDNNKSISGSYTTTNTVTAVGAGEGYSEVTSSQPDGSLIAMRSTSVASVAGIASGGASYTPAGVLAGTGWLNTKDATNTADVRTAVAVDLGTLAAGQSVTFRISYVLSEAEASLPPDAPSDPMVATVAADDASVAEGGDATFTVSVDATSGADVVIPYEVSGTADESDLGDYDGTVTIRSGETSATITIPTVDDEAVEGDETVVVTLEDDAPLDVSPAFVVGDPAEATVTLTSDDHRRPPSIVAGGSGNITPDLVNSLKEKLPADVAYRSITVTPDGTGSWGVTPDGGVVTGGTAPFLGSMGGQHLNSPAVGIAATESGSGYFVVTSDGGVFAFGDAQYQGSMGGTHLNQPVVGLTPSCSDKDGYFLVARDGGVFTFGDVSFWGSMGATPLNKDMIGIVPSCSDTGYWTFAADGGVFAFGDAPFFGSLGGSVLDSPIVGMIPTATGQGYWLIDGRGVSFPFGDALAG